MFNRRSRDQSSGVVPVLEDLTVDLLYLPKAYKDVFWRHSDGEGLITTVVDELDGKLLSPMNSVVARPAISNRPTPRDQARHSLLLGHGDVMGPSTLRLLEPFSGAPVRAEVFSLTC